MTMETTRASGTSHRASTASSLSTAASATLKSAALRAKTVSSSSTIETRKRKRGALQDISNNARIGGASGAPLASSKKASTASASASATSKPPVKASVATRHGAKSGLAGINTANVTTKPRANKASAASTATATVVTKRRRQQEETSNACSSSSGAESHAPHSKKQTSLLSFQSIAPPQKPSSKTTAKEEKPLKTEEPQQQQQHQQAAGSVPSEDKQEDHDDNASVPYVPRPYAFTYDHRDSGFDEETYRTQVHDIDAPFQHSAIHCVKIARDMDRFHRQHETKYHPDPSYIGSVQLDINEKMRGILVDWLVEVGEEYELDSQTFHKTVNLVDRCLAKFKINRKQFQLLGCACMMVAAKFEEVYGPNVDEFVYISDQTYTAEEMLEMEVKVLQALEYRIASTTCHGFLPRFTRAGCATDKQKALVEYLCDYAMLDYNMLQYRPSQLAASAVYLSRLMTNEDQPWTPTLHHLAQFNAWDLKPCVMDLFRLHHTENVVVQTQRDKAKAVSEKYLGDKFHGVSAIPSVQETDVEKSFEVYTKPSYGSPVSCSGTTSAAATAEAEASPTNNAEPAPKC